MVIPIVIGTLGKITEGLVKGLEDLEKIGRVKNTQITALLRSATILGGVLESWGHSNSSVRPSANADVKNSQVVVVNNNITPPSL